MSVTYNCTVRANEFLIFAHRLMILYICTKICKISRSVSVLLREHNLHTGIYRGRGGGWVGGGGGGGGRHNDMKTIGRVMHPFSAYYLMTFYICTNFQEYISKGFKVIKRTHPAIYKGA